MRIGHRGAAALEPENTLRAFGRAIELGVDFVELDVLDLADGTLVVAHSDDLLEVSHGTASGRYSERTGVPPADASGARDAGWVIGTRDSSDA